MGGERFAKNHRPGEFRPSTARDFLYEPGIKSASSNPRRFIVEAPGRNEEGILGIIARDFGSSEGVSVNPLKPPKYEVLFDDSHRNITLLRSVMDQVGPYLRDFPPDEK